jgi:hypothetical protein
MARRALLLLDGLDEAGANRAATERHVTEVLAPQVRDRWIELGTRASAPRLCSRPVLDPPFE